MPDPATTPLLARRERFCQRYAAHGIAAKAAEEAGYSARSANKTGYTLLQDATVKARLAQLQGAVAARNETDADYILANAREVVERCMQRAPVMTRKGKGWEQATDADGNDLWQFDARGAVAGLTLIAKMGGLFPDKANVQVNTTGPVTVSVTHRVIDPVKQSPN